MIGRLRLTRPSYVPVEIRSPAHSVFGSLFSTCRSQCSHSQAFLGTEERHSFSDLIGSSLRLCGKLWLLNNMPTRLTSWKKPSRKNQTPVFIFFCGNKWRRNAFFLINLEWLMLFSPFQHSIAVFALFYPRNSGDTGYYCRRLLFFRRRFRPVRCCCCCSELREIGARQSSCQCHFTDSTRPNGVPSLVILGPIVNSSNIGPHVCEFGYDFVWRFDGEFGQRSSLCLCTVGSWAMVILSDGSVWLFMVLLSYCLLRVCKNFEFDAFIVFHLLLSVGSPPEMALNIFQAPSSLGIFDRTICRMVAWLLDWLVDLIHGLVACLLDWLIDWLISWTKLHSSCIHIVHAAFASPHAV